MTTELDERSKLEQKINGLSASEIQKLKIFISGLEAAKEVSEQCRKQSA